MLVSDFLRERADFSAKIDKELITAIETDRVYLHHTSSARGYVRAKSIKIDYYEGKFGRGFIVGYPNKKGFLNGSGRYCFSNTYYRIDYWIFA